MQVIYNSTRSMFEIALGSLKVLLVPKKLVCSVKKLQKYFFDLFTLKMVKTHF
jgi:hypothetical protein